MLFLLVYWRFVRTSLGSAIREVQCEKCQERFAYEIVRLGIGSDVSPYFLRDEAAEASASKQSQRDLTRRIAKETDPVPCPHCGWMQDDMIRGVRRGMLQWIRPLVYGSWAIWGFVLFLAAGTEYSVKGSNGYWTAVIVPNLGLALWPVGVGIGLLICRWLLALRYSPNRYYPTPADSPPCAPVALLAGRDGKWAPVAPRKVLLDNGRVAMRLHGQPFPQTCCSCLGPQQRVFIPSKMPFAKNPRLNVPICHSCAQRIKDTIVLWFVVLTIVAVAIASYCINLLGTTTNPDGQTLATVFIAIVLAVTGLLIIPYWMAAPYRTYGFDSRRLTCQMRFRNPAYAKAIAAYELERSSEQALERPNQSNVTDGIHIHGHRT